jgi:hypothetical protein
MSQNAHISALVVKYPFLADLDALIKSCLENQCPQAAQRLKVIRAQALFELRRP